MVKSLRGNRESIGVMKGENSTMAEKKYFSAGFGQGKRVKERTGKREKDNISE